jgi:1,4-dihydroxy-2-naphthoyl-CoA hydrolase
VHVAETTFPTDLLDRLAAGETVRADEVGFEAGGFDRTALGIVWDSFARDRIEAHLDCGPQHQQPYGIVHGGVWCGVVETLASFAAALRAAADDRLTVGVSNATDFLRSHREGRVDAVATPIHVGRLQQLWQVEIRRASDGKPVARGQVRMQNIDAAQIGGAA